MFVGASDSLLRPPSLVEEDPYPRADCKSLLASLGLSGSTKPTRFLAGALWLWSEHEVLAWKLRCLLYS